MIYHIYFLPIIMEKANLIMMFLLIVAISLGAVVLGKKLLLESQAPIPSPNASVDTTLFSSQSPAGSSLQSQTQQQTQPAKEPELPQPQLPLEKNKKLAKFPGILAPDQLQNKAARIYTAKGDIDFQIYPEASMAASNFLVLASNGFYNNLAFHRVEDWVTQGGDPSGDGSGGPGYQFPDEPVNRAYERGIVAMANSGPNTNGSQFFILKKDYPLEPKYTIFGKVVSGMDVVDKLTVGDIIQKVIVGNLK